MKYLLSIYCIGVFSFLGYMQQEKPLKQSILDGEEIYQDFCLQCHLDNGKGVENAFPPLAKSDYLQNNIEATIRGIKYGLRGEIIVNGNTYNGVMVNQGLDEEEVADVMNYILNSWDNKAENQITVAQVLEVQKQ
ncbi:MAG: cytochrome c [Flavobacteriaceae bacterium]|nr:cytochrome c [Flavobacteriaceae bacterium]